MHAPLPPVFRTTPVAHRALHDRSAGRPENSRAAVLAAVEAGYAIEIDLQRSADGQAMVFHDYDLNRLTTATGPLAIRTAAELATIRLTDAQDGIPTLPQILSVIAGRVPLLIEIKDQDGAMGPDVGPLESATAQALTGYEGPVAVMSFNPHSMAAMARLAPHIPRGLTTSAFDPAAWGPLPAHVCDQLRDIPDYDRVGASFISHEWGDLARPRVAAMKSAGAAILCWTIRSPTAEATARAIADNITFEHYAAALPA
ncbi:phosphodiesterase [Fertoebacter nigrum]|uniref:Phosphodiesterase n=1 Tax=Fertoeibacter niger TaxID=2656921 RepID=A0A8X8GZJ1_9RHOB|nr:glycerophosphodiester phosphodiesterase family protein [Fertoeibacter niger]NUB46032.1 phosphodiesterase [Fertoeibacter niger]